MYKKVTQTLCFAILVAGLSACETPNPNVPTATLRVIASGHPEWPPVMFRAGNDIAGIGPDLLEAIFDDIGLDVEINYTGTWDEVQAKARTGEVDMLAGAYKTSAREEYMLYAGAYISDPVVIYVKTGQTFAFDDWDVLIGKSGVAMVGDSYGQAFDDFAAANLNLTRATTVAQAYELVETGQADYMLYSLYAGDDYLSKAGQSAEFEHLPTYVNEENFYITISKQSQFVAYYNQINAALERFKTDGTLAAIYAKHGLTW